MNKKNLNYAALIKESAETLKIRLSNKSQSACSRQRLEYLYLLKTGECITQEAAGLRIGDGATAHQQDILEKHIYRKPRKRIYL